MEFNQAVNRIHPVLRRDDFRFVPIYAGQKKPFEPGWNVPGSRTNYRYNDPKLVGYLAEGHNYGVVAGFGNLIVFDADNLVRLTELGVMADLPDTFTVRTGGGGTHKYYTSDLDKKLVMYDFGAKDADGQRLHLGEVQSRGFQAVGPGSLHPNGSRYTVEVDTDIAYLASPDLYDILRNRVDVGVQEAEPQRKRLRVVMVDPRREDPFDSLRVSDVWRPQGIAKKTSTGWKGAHPVHGSTTGNNFVIDERENTWHCWRCGSGGGAALAIAVKEGLLRCDQARAGVLRGELFLQVVAVAREKGYIGQRRPSNCRVERVA